MRMNTLTTENQQFHLTMATMVSVIHCCCEQWTEWSFLTDFLDEISQPQHCRVQTAVEKMSLQRTTWTSAMQLMIRAITSVSVAAACTYSYGVTFSQTK